MATSPSMTVWGDQADNEQPARLLAPEFHRHHPALWSAEFTGIAGQEPVVIFQTGVVHIGGAAEGEHDGLRSSASTGHWDFSGVRRGYCTREQWVEAGNSPL